MNRLFTKIHALAFQLRMFLRNGSVHRYEYAVEMSSDTAAANVVRMVGTGRKVLEIGAGPGSITRLLSRQNQCEVTAIELDDSAIEKLGEFCKRVIKIDLNTADWRDALSDDGPFESIVIADVLEHLVDPWQALAAARSLLARDGELIVSLPHVGHNAIVACLLNADFEYRDFGLLDRTHIRFFGIKNIQRLFQDANFKIVEARFVIRTPERTELAAQWNMLSDDLRTILARNPYGNIYQVVVKVVAADGIDSGLDLTRLTAINKPSS
ncbi:MAG: hypothetical protein CRU78_10635 [Candidatus Accumulibacter phosphatis]|uniref:Class I SAM-dependent methyltransferase n=1 Tax=Candidatus Accumulibacter phosphatis TaxID=327160 RepID=A0A6A7RVJ5_9PROT|nr:hypothetical protein [Candidatus Accumulibacter phosphatis]